MIFRYWSFSFKVLVVLLCAGILSACYQEEKPSEVIQIPSATSIQASDTPTRTDTPTPSETPTLPPTLTDTPTSSPTFTSSPTPACFKLLSPPGGARVAELGVVKFEWEPYTGAQRYLLKIAAPDGLLLTFDTYSTSVNRYLNTIPLDGIYSWQVVAMNADGGVLCISDPLTFSKPRFIPSITPDINPPIPRHPELPNNGGG